MEKKERRPYLLSSLRPFGKRRLKYLYILKLIEVWNYQPSTKLVVRTINVILPIFVKKKYSKSIWMSSSNLKKSCFFYNKRIHFEIGIFFKCELTNTIYNKILYIHHNQRTLIINLYKLDCHCTTFSYHIENGHNSI